MKYTLLSFFLLISSITFAQEIANYEEKTEYEIADIQIHGAENRDRVALKSLAGLKVGQVISIPGEETARAIKNLMKLKLFDDVQILSSKTDGNLIYLIIKLVERPTLSTYSYEGVKKSHKDDLDDILKSILNKAGIVTQAQKELAKDRIVKFYKEKGRYDATVKIKEIKDPKVENAVNLIFAVNQGKRVKIDNITFDGNKSFSDRKLRKRLGTKKRWTLFKKSKLVEEEYEEHKKNLIAFYNKKGFRDARIVSDSIWRNADSGNLEIKIKIDEGNKYYHRNIVWKGNSLYNEEQLNTVLGIRKGDVYNPELLGNRLQFSQDGRDISSLYMDDGYLFFRAEPTEVAIEGDSIDIEMRIYEGPQATVDRVTIAGNDRTNEHVIRRAIRTRPGQKFSRSDIIRSQREIIALGFFDPATLGVNTPVNPERGTVDIEYTVEEKPSDQLELSAGYGGGGSLIGTLGVTFNNFSVKNIGDRSTWNPLPQGDGQKVSLRAQSNGQFFKSYNFTFTEPWLGGKKPTSLTLGGVYSAQDYSLSGNGKLSIARLFAGIGTQLKWPDDYFSSSTTVKYEQIKLDGWYSSDFFIQDNDNFIFVRDGKFNNFSLNQTFVRSNIADPLFPRSGSRVSLSIDLTPPYSLFRKQKAYEVSDQEREAIRTYENEWRGTQNQLTEKELDQLVLARTNAKKFQWLEYHKWKINTEWYYNIVDKLVFRTEAKFGFIGGYNSKLGAPPFERFKVGGDGLTNQNQSLTGTEVISLRGYEESEINRDPLTGYSLPGTVYDKFQVELRYPLSLNPNSTIYVKTFLQGGYAWNKFSDFNPFQMKKSAGVGMRVFLPMFGLLGFDYAAGFDKNLNSRKLGDYAKFSIVLGFEPE